MPKFTEELSTIGLISKPARDELGEDCYYCVRGKNSALVSVFDGCGGLGARKYDTFQGHTGAYIASRAVSGAVHDWYHKNSRKRWKDAAELSEGINEAIRGAYEVCSSFAVDTLKIRGSMVRKFPTTMALAYAQQETDGILIHVLWAGDSRVYLLDEGGLAQLTVDDTDERDAFANLTSDSPMTNVLSADGNYEIHHKSLLIRRPAMIFAATDGCFGYIPSPMEFEYEILTSMVQAVNPKNFRYRLRNTLAEYAGDDLALGYFSFYYDDFEEEKELMGRRLQKLEENYISAIREDDTDSCRKALWEKYKPAYERAMD